MTGPARKFANVPDFGKCHRHSPVRGCESTLDSPPGTAPEIKDRLCLPFRTRHVIRSWRKCSLSEACLSRPPTTTATSAPCSAFPAGPSRTGLPRVGLTPGTCRGALAFCQPISRSSSGTAAGRRRNRLVDIQDSSIYHRCVRGSVADGLMFFSLRNFANFIGGFADLSLQSSTRKRHIK
jgi:hypothetical protein